MAQQLALLDPSPPGLGLPVALDWPLDEETKRRGREGLALARAALAEAVRRVAA